MGFGSWPIKIERKVPMIFEPGGIQVYVQAIARNEGVQIIHTHVGTLLSQSRKRYAWGRQLDAAQGGFWGSMLIS